MRWSICVLSVAVCAAPAFARAEDKVDDAFRRITTALWSAEVPVTWSKGKKVVRATHTRWVFASPTRNYQFRVNVAKDTGGDFKKLAEANLERMKKRMSALQILSQEYGTSEGRPYLHVMLRGQMQRNKNKHDFITTRIVSRLGRKLLLTLSLSGHTEHIGDFTAVANRILSSLHLDPSTKSGLSQPAPVTK